MSIRHFSIQPCPDCGRDTTHVAMRCRECGHINIPPSQQREEARRKARYRRYSLKGEARRKLEQTITENKIAKAKADAARTRSFVPAAPAIIRGSGRSMFGRGKTRTKT